MVVSLPPIALPTVRFTVQDGLVSACAAVDSFAAQTPTLGYTVMARLPAMTPRDLATRRRFETSDGAMLAYRTYEAEHCNLHLVLIHGSACFGDQLHILASLIARRGAATVHTLDMRGHGGSPPVGDDPACFANDVLEFVRNIQKTEPNASIALGGHSAGGGLLLRLADIIPKGVIAGWLFLAPFLGLGSWTMKPNFGGWVSFVNYPAYFATVTANMLGSRKLNSQPLIQFSRDTFLYDPRFTREWNFTTILGFGPPPAGPFDATLVEDPALLIAGDSDECFHTQHYAEELAVIAPEAKSIILPRLGHWDILADESSVDACVNFLRSLRQVERPRLEAELPELLVANG